jgi:WD40 repeat protein
MPKETNGDSDERLDTWKDIASHLDRHERTAVRWAKSRGLPVHQIPGGQRPRVFAYRRELDAWLAGEGRAENEVTPQEGGNDANADPSSALHSALVETPPVNFQTAARTARNRKWRIYSLAGFLAVIAFTVVAYQYANSRFSLRSPQLIGQQKLTDNFLEKRGLLTDGRSLYFAQEQDGWFALAVMPVDGGQIRILWSPKANIWPLDISPDGRKILALTSVAVERDRELWVVPLDRGEPHRLSNIMAHSAAWAPDGKTIAYSAANGIYLSSESDPSPKKIGSFASLPTALEWSRDGRRLRFVLKDNATDKAESWGEISGEGMEVVTVHSLSPSAKLDGNWTPAGNRSAWFISGLGLKRGSTPVWMARYGTRTWEPTLQVAPIGYVSGEIHEIATSEESSRIFVLSELQMRSPFISFDQHAQSFRKILPGASGEYLDYSRDGQWVSYTSFHDGLMWISRADGSSPRQITFPPEQVELPRWSPDGKRIAYMSQRGDRPWRIYILDLGTGATREASEGDDSQGAPTWSPDGRYIAYGNVRCEHTRSCAIHRIDLATGKVQTLPDSDDLFTARWSPDGRLIAALHLERHQLMLFNVKSGKWRKLADAINGSDLSWSADSKYLYADVHGTNARIVRIRVADEHLETVLDLQAQERFGFTDSDDLQFSLAPDDSVILHHKIRSEEIFAYDLRDR